MNKLCVIDYNNKKFEKVSSECYRIIFILVNFIGMSLLKSMLEIDPVKRPSATECISHSFFQMES